MRQQLADSTRFYSGQHVWPSSLFCNLLRGTWKLLLDSREVTADNGGPYSKLETIKFRWEKENSQ